jgi:hypothetical protein
MQVGAGALRANTFAPELTKRTTPRLDTPEKLTAASIRAARAPIEPPIVGSREALLLYVDQLPGGSPIAANAPKARRRKVTKSTKKRTSVPAELSVAVAEAKLEGLRVPRP